MSSDSASVLVTGATGRLGRRLIPELVDTGWSILAVGLPDDPALDLISGNPQVEVYLADLAGKPDLSAAVDGVGAVVHAGARLPGPGTSDRDCFESIVTGTFNLLKEVARCAAPDVRFVYVSSTAVYGPQLAPVFTPISEDHPVRPTSVYGAAKAASETFVQTYGRSHGLAWSIVRPSDIVTAKDFQPPEGFVAKRLTFDLDKRRVTVAVGEDGSTVTRSFASAGDVARGIVAVLTSQRAVGEVFHVGPRCSSSDLEIAGVIARRRGLELHTVDERQDHRSWVIVSEKAKQMLGFHASDELDTMLAEEST